MEQLRPGTLNPSPKTINGSTRLQCTAMHSVLLGLSHFQLSHSASKRTLLGAFFVSVNDKQTVLIACHCRAKSWTFSFEKMNKGSRHQKLEFLSSQILVALVGIRSAVTWCKEVEVALFMPCARIGPSCGMHSHCGSAVDRAVGESCLSICWTLVCRP